MKSIRLPLSLLVAAATLATAAWTPRSARAETASDDGPWSAAPMDWPYWRGPEMNGISREKNIPAEWTQNRGSRKGKNVLWFNKEIGSRSTPIVMNGKLYTILRDQPGTPMEGEKVICVDPANGKVLWENRFNVYLSDVPDSRVGWSSVVGDPQTGDVFALGVCGYFQCLDGKTGETKWSHSMSEEYGLLSTYGGRTNFPIVHGDLVIISAIVIGWGDMAKPAHRFIAFDKRNGQVVWFRGTRLLPYDTTYSAPVIAIIDGEPQLIFASGDGDLHGFQPQTGKSLWHYHVSPKRGVNTTPLVVGHLVYCGHAEENPIPKDPNAAPTMGALFCVDASKRGLLTKENGGEVWRHNQWYVGKAAPLHVNGFIYAVENGGTVRVVEAKTGRLVETTRLGGPAFASPLYADGKIFVGTTNGLWFTFEPQKDGKLKRLYRARLRGAAIYGSPVVSHGRLFIPTTTGLYCVGNKGAKPVADPRPPFPTEPPVKASDKAAWLQLAPAESLLKPGQTQQFQVRLYNDKGQYLRLAGPADVKFTLDGDGTIDRAGKYTTEEENGSYAVAVTAEAAGLKGTARIRIVPELPWNIDFNNGVIPVTWVGCRYRHIPLDFDLYTKLKDKQKDLLAARLYIHLQTAFSNGLPGVKPGTFVYNNKPPFRHFDQMLQYLQLDTKVKTLEEAKAALEPKLKLLTAEGVIKGHQWSESKATGVQLVVERGPRKVEGNGVMCKIATIPKGQRSQGWLGRADLSNYTVQADVQGADRVSTLQQGGKTVTIVQMPDIGISAQRYALVLKGAQQQLEIRTWHPVLRMAKHVPFKWKPNAWYTLKLQASVEKGKAVLRGKCWERGQPEPREWNIVAEDPSPNEQGAPGLFGDASLAELFYDNLKVYKNP